MGREFPDILKKLHAIEIDYADGDGIDFEPFGEFHSEEDTSDWIKAWTGNSSLDGSDYLIFGQDGTGGYVAIWLVRNDSDLLQQPIVFFGSEGEVGVIARNFRDYIWLFANGIGPYEAVAYPGLDREKTKSFWHLPRSLLQNTKAQLLKLLEGQKPNTLISKNQLTNYVSNARSANAPRLFVDALASAAGALIVLRPCCDRYFSRRYK